MTLNLGTWQAVVRKKMFKTGNFKALDRVVVEYVLRNSASNPKPKTNLAAAWQAWTQKFTDKGRTYKSSDRYTAGCALDDIARVVQPPALPSRTARPPAASPRQAAAQQHTPLTPHQQQIHDRDAQNPHIRPSGHNYVKTAAGWKPKIFSQEENYSCTCACATTFLSKLINKPVTEDAFKKEFRNTTGAAHDFSKGGTYWEPIVKTLHVFEADAQFRKTDSWDALKAYLDKASESAPVMLGIEWEGGGGHAVMCVGKGQIPGWQGSEGPGGGYRMEDPWGQNELPGMMLNGTYYVRDSSTKNISKATAVHAAGCVTGKISPREFGKAISVARGGVKVM